MSEHYATEWEWQIQFKGSGRWKTILDGFSSLEEAQKSKMHMEKIDEQPGEWFRIIRVKGVTHNGEV